MKDKEEEMRDCKDCKAELVKKLYIPAIELVREDLQSPRTVCVASKCVKHYVLPPRSEYIFRKLKFLIKNVTQLMP